MRKIYLAAVLLGTTLAATFAVPAQAASVATAYTTSDKWGQIVVYRAGSGKANPGCN